MIKKQQNSEIHSKQFVGSTVVVEYKVKVTNVGDLAGNVYEILSEIPSKNGIPFRIKFRGWTKSLANSISNVSFTKIYTIKPGESIETTIVLNETLDDKDAGTYTNIAKISTSESQRHTEDSNVNNDTDQTRSNNRCCNRSKNSLQSNRRCDYGIIIYSINDLLYQRVVE